MRLFFICYSNMQNSSKYTSNNRTFVLPVRENISHLVVPMHFLILKRKIPTLELSDEEHSLL